MLTALISTIAMKVGVNGMLLLSICQVESGLRPVNNFKDGNGGSYGVCMINEKTAKSFFPFVDRLALQQPSENITIAAMYLKKLYSKYNNPWHSVAAFNAGKARMENGQYRNAEYVAKVKRVYCSIEDCI